MCIPQDHNVMITRTIKAFPNQKVWMNGEIRALPRAKKSCLWPGSIITRQKDWAGKTSNTKWKMWQAIQNITGYKSRGAPSCVRPCFQMSIAHFNLTLISFTKRVTCQVYSAYKEVANVSIHSECKKNPDGSDWVKLQGLGTSQQVSKLMLLWIFFNIQKSVPASFKTATITSTSA